MEVRDERVVGWFSGRTKGVSRSNNSGSKAALAKEGKKKKLNA